MAGRRRDDENVAMSGMNRSAIHAAPDGDFMFCKIRDPKAMKSPVRLYPSLHLSSTGEACHCGARTQKR